MKQKTLLLMVLTMVLFSINVNAQRRELRTAKNGYQWYRIYEDGKYSAEGKDGSLLIPLSRGYNYISFYPLNKSTGFFTVGRNGKYGVCDIAGKEVIVPNKYNFVCFHEEEGHVGYYGVEIDGAHGVCDITGKEIIPCQYESIIYLDCFKYKKTNGNFIASSIKLDNQGRAFDSGIASSSSSSSTSSSSSSSTSSSSSNSSKQKQSKKTKKAAEDDEVSISLFDILESVTDYYNNSPEVQKAAEEKKARNEAANALSSYSDAQYFGFKGKVKKCDWVAGGYPLVENPWMEYTINFSSNGKIETDKFKFDRESNGRIILMETNSGLKEYKFNYDEYGRINRVEEKSYGLFGDAKTTTYYYSYDSNDRIILSNYYHSILGDLKYQFYNFSNDSKGNWIKCNLTVTDKNGKREFVVKRIIEYY